MATIKSIRAKQLSYWLTLVSLCAFIWGCGSQAANSVLGMRTKFRPYDLLDQQLGGIPMVRIAIPEDWKGVSRLVWNLNAYYMPVHDHMRAEAPDGGSWVEFYGTEMFAWFDRAHERGSRGNMDASGAIHYPNVTLPEAMARCIIARYRRNAKNLRILGYRPVSDLPRAFPHVPLGSLQGNGICMRVQYELDGSPVDEEFYGFMPQPDVIPYSSTMTEYHSYLYLAHSIGAKSGKLESVRPLLGFISTSLELNPA